MALSTQCQRDIDDLLDQPIQHAWSEFHLNALAAPLLQPSDTFNVALTQLRDNLTVDNRYAVVLNTLTYWIDCEQLRIQFEHRAMSAHDYELSMKEELLHFVQMMQFLTSP